MPASYADDDDRPATRRDLAQLREVLEAKLRAEIAEVNARMAEGFAKVEQRFAKMEQRFAEMEQRFAEMEQRFAKIEQRFAKIEQRFGRLDSKIANQTRVLVTLNVLISGAMAAAIIRATG